MGGSGGRRLYLIYLVGLVLWVSMIVVAPALASSSGIMKPLSRPIYFVFSAICHQKDDRCLHLMGEPFAACSRCTFMYLGVLASSIAYPLLGWPRRPRVLYLFIAAAPLILDGGTQLIGLRESTNTIRALTGVIFGCAMAFYIAPEAVPTVSLLISRIKKWKAPSPRRL
jgi:uncharacterized membrane protein